MPRSLRVVIGLAVSALFIVLLLRQVDGGELAGALRDIRPGWLLLAAIPYLAGLWLRAQRWRRVLRPSLTISGGDAFALLLVGYAANNVLPVRAGDVVRAGLLQRRHGGAWSLGLGTIVVERVLDGLVLSAFLAAAVLLAGAGPLLRAMALLAAAGFVAATLLLVLLVIAPGSGAARAAGALRLAPAPLRPRLQASLSGFLDGLTTLRGGGAWARVTALTAASWICEGASYWLVGVALGLPLQPPLYAGVLGAANLALVAPSTAGGIGPFEFFAREAVVAHGVSPAAGAAYAIAVHAFVLAPVVLLGVAVMWRLQLGARTLLGAREPAAGEGAGSGR